METSQRSALTGTGEKTQDRSSFRIARAFHLAVTSSRTSCRRMHQTPIWRSAPSGAKLVETVTRTAASPSSTTSKSRSCATP